ncbi:hypothetical protein PR048_015846 [Dryococelus australis]|uniref:DUF5641 domain-containing protein n=1 Tax=Dryococelus australis TaxID=614101 RepID=A0ABQ9HIE2_9NEOP|nr:hypothetical protein PR048_015846 [Dryococelus australis]
MGTTCLRYEELVTLVTQIEACINSRPLVTLYNDHSDPKALTPGHLIISTAIINIPEPDLGYVKLGLLSRWQLLQQKIQQWSKEYLNWTSSSENIKPGELVVLKEDRVPPLCWRMGVMEEVHSGTGVLGRVATAKTSTGGYKKLVTNLCPLAVN